MDVLCRSFSIHLLIGLIDLLSMCFSSVYVDIFRTYYIFQFIMWFTNLLIYSLIHLFNIYPEKCTNK